MARTRPGPAAELRAFPQPPATWPSPAPFHQLFIFGTFGPTQGPFVILRRQQEIALRCLSFFFLCSFGEAKMVKMLHYYFYYLFAFNT